MKVILILLISALTFISCEKCKECYFIEENNGTTTETPLGEFCGDEIDEQEAREFIPVTGTAYIECR